MAWTDFCTVQINIEVLDVNDNKPLFSRDHYFASILENSPKGSLLANSSQLTATDADSTNNRVVHYSLVSGSKFFQIDPANGLITQSTSKLNRESAGKQLELTVRATDLGGLYSDCNVTINVTDINDNHPVFEQATLFLTLQENLPTGFVVTKLNAIDLDDNSSVAYFLVNSTSGDKFRVDNVTGEVVLAESLDYEEESSFVLYVGAFDVMLGKEAISNRSIVKLHIDVLDLNDNAPEFNSSVADVYYVKENVPVNTTIGVLSAFDLDLSDSNRDVEFGVEGVSKYFGVDGVSGRLFVKAELDFESLGRPVFNLTVVCRNGRASEELESRRQVQVVVEDVNDNGPVFTRQNQTIIFRESFELGKEITRFVFVFIRLAWSFCFHRDITKYKKL